MYFGHLNRKNNMPRKYHWNDHTLPIGSGTMFTNHKAKRSRKAFEIKEPNNNRLIIAAVVFMVLICGAIFFLTEAMRVEAVAPTPVDESNRGCIASAYQATQNGFDLEANLSVCD